MIKHIWSVLSESAAIDHETNTVSIFNILENLMVAGDPEKVKGIPLRFVIISLWERTDDAPTEGALRLSLIKPNGEMSEPLQMKIDLSQSHFHRTRIAIQGLPLVGAGRYAYQIEYKEGEAEWQKAAELPILVNFGSLKDDAQDS